MCHTHNTQTHETPSRKVVSSGDVSHVRYTQKCKLVSVLLKLAPCETFGTFVEPSFTLLSSCGGVGLVFFGIMHMKWSDIPSAICATQETAPTSQRSQAAKKHQIYTQTTYAHAHTHLRLELLVLG